ncbi:MAG: nucleoid-associated protein, YbaB/EbfC family [Ignavibacteria bacterium GWF2_33_9]|nr:MAG: nucleoid-associated protein, YbaB/EbfC family [Ignavibacteria bacterium GWF2_33_9]
MQSYASELSKVKQELDKISISASSGGGMVEVQINGAHLVTNLTISDYLFEMQDKKMIEDLVIGAVNNANKKLEEELAKQSQSKLDSVMKDIFKNKQA